MAITVECSSGAFAAFSPKLMKLTAGAGESSVITTLYAEDAETILTTIYSEFFNSEVKINISNFGCRLFENLLVEVGSNVVAKVFNDHRRYVIFCSSIPDDYIRPYTALNAVLKAGLPAVSSNDWGYKILTRAKTLLYYPGYTDKSYLAVLVSTGLPDLLFEFVYPFDEKNFRSVKTDDVYDRVAIVYLNDDYAETLTKVSVSDGSITMDEKPVVYQCIPAAPFYVRWMNDIAGVEHWMFSGKQINKTEITDQEVFTKRVDTNEELATASRLVSATKKETITVGSQSVSVEDATILNTLTFSPLIEYYDAELQIWQKILVESSSVPLNLDELFCEVQFTFTLPTTNIQTY